jgi:diguanylate cyclase (GGDEF)-like protein/PAS domain S-box-containing protein
MEDSIFKDLLDNLADGVYFTDGERRITFWNKGAERITGFSRQEIIGKRCLDNILVHVDAQGNQLCVEGCPLSATIQDGINRDADVFLKHKDGHRVPIRVRVAPLINAEGLNIGGVEVFTENSEKLRIEERLSEMEKLALLDSLTELPNRRYLESQIRSRMEELRRNRWSFGILFIDIDHFKKINDSFGHDIGDRVLRMVGKTLDANSRYFDTVGRWGGEEFVVLLANTNLQSLAEVSERFRALVESAWLTEKGNIGVTISIGGTLAQENDDLESLTRRADERLYKAKQLGRNRVQI